MPVASLRLRLLAGLADAGAVIAAAAVVIGVGVVGALGYARVFGAGKPDSEAEVEPHDGDDDGRNATGRSRLLRPLHGALWGASAGLAVAGRNWRSPGFHLVGLRRVDADTGGSVGVRGALLGVLFDQAWQAAWRLPFKSRADRHRTRTRALAPQLRALERKRAGNPQERQRAVRELYKSNDVNALSGCGWLLAGPAASQLVLTLSLHDGRTVRDRITGTVVIVDR